MRSSLLDRLAAALERLSLAIEKIAGVLLALITLVVVVSAIGRYVFAAPIPDAFDVSRLVLGAAIMWGFASLGYRGGHIQVEILAEVLPPRPQKVLEVLAWLLLLVFTVLLVWKMLDRVESARASGEATFDLRLPVWPLMAVIWAGVAASVVTVVARIVLILTGDEPARAPGEGRGNE